MKTETFYDQITGYFRELEKRISVSSHSFIPLILCLVSFVQMVQTGKSFMLSTGECFPLYSLPALFSMLMGTSDCWEAFVFKNQLVSF